MIFVRLLPVLLSFLLLAAHFSRIDLLLLLILALVIPNLLFNQRKWVARLLQTALMLGSTEWIRAMLMHISQRKVSGSDWLRLAIILGILARCPAFSALVFQGPSLRERYPLNHQTEPLKTRNIAILVTTAFSYPYIFESRYGVIPPIFHTARVRIFYRPQIPP